MHMCVISPEYRSLLTPGRQSAIPRRPNKNRHAYWLYSSEVFRWNVCCRQSNCILGFLFTASTCHRLLYRLLREVSVYFETYPWCVNRDGDITSSSLLMPVHSRYPHMPIGKVWIYRLLFVLLCFLFVRLRISPARIKLAASNFARRFIGVLGRESLILGNLVSPEAQNRTNRRAQMDIWSACVDNRQSPSLFMLLLRWILLNQINKHTRAQ